MRFTMTIHRSQVAVMVQLRPLANGLKRHAQALSWAQRLVHGWRRIWVNDAVASNLRAMASNLIAMDVR